MDGEIITKATPDIGYLHRGDEKIAENMHYNQFVPYTDRLDYLAPLANNVAYAMAVEKLMGWKLPPRGEAIRLICCEISRISSHLLGLGAFAMDTGAMTVFLYTFTEREKIYNLWEIISGARFTTSYTRVGGMTRDLAPAFFPMVRKFLDEFPPVVDEIDKLLSRNRIFVDRTKDIGVISKEQAIDYALSGPNLRGSGIDHDLRKKHPYLGYDRCDFDVPDRLGGRLLRPLSRSDGRDAAVGAHPEPGAGQPARRSNQCRRSKELSAAEDDRVDQDGRTDPPFIIHTEGPDAPPGEIYFGVENPKGELGFYINSRGGGTPHRLKIRAPSFVNLSILSDILPGHMMSDVVAILGSLDFVMGECDR
jgi:NADH-quinone oxidoreductase subunit D